MQGESVGANLKSKSLTNEMIDGDCSAFVCASFSTLAINRLTLHSAHVHVLCRVRTDATVRSSTVQGLFWVRAFLHPQRLFAQMAALGVGRRFG